jgi:probable rRNA maturation factor
MTHDLQLEIAEGVDAQLDLEALRAVVARLLDAERPEGASLAVQFADDALLQALNREHRGTDEPTDVLSFASEEGEAFPSAPDDQDDDEAGYLGDIAVSVEFAQRAAEEGRLDLDAEVQHLVVHGVLHLLGYDHATDREAAVMEAAEEELLGPGIHEGRTHEDG